MFIICPVNAWKVDRMVQGAAFVELYFVLSSLFASRAYYAFGFVALTAGIVTLTTATVSILFTYFILCAEEYRLVRRPSFPTGFLSN
jgi:transmembrane 9 superfamily protein 2/4